MNVGYLINSFATYLMYCLPWSIKGLIDSPITVLATSSDFPFIPRSRSTSIFDFATFKALARSSVCCIISGMLKISPTAKSRDRNASQSHSVGKQLRNSVAQSFAIVDEKSHKSDRLRKSLGHAWAQLTS